MLIITRYVIEQFSILLQFMFDDMEKRDNLRQKLKKSIIPSGPQRVVEPEKELRFTRSAQAIVFYVISVIGFAVSMGVFILSTQDWGMGGPILDGWQWLCLPGLLFTAIFFRMGLKCTRHAYLILNPLGIEIFPFYKPEKNLQILYWSEIEEAEVDLEKQQLVLHFSKDQTSGVVVSLSPIPKRQQSLLKKAVLGRMEKQQNV